MAGALKGITVEIGGDTTKLGKALQDVNGKSKSLQSELKGVNSLLKMDPGNVTLLAQKQKLLTDAIAQTKNKLDTLKIAQTQAQEQFEKGEITEEQYRDLQREIVATEQKLKTLTDDLDEFGSVGAQKVALVGEKMQDVGGKVENFGKKLSLVSAGAVAILAGSMASFVELDEGYDTIITKTGATGEALEDLNNVADNIFGSMPVDMTNVGTAVGEINTRFGYTGEKLESLSRQFLQFAEINGVDLNNSIGTVDKVLEQFNMDASEAGNVLDIVTKKAQETGIGADSLLNSIQQNGATFKDMGLGVNEAVVMMAQFEANGVNVETALKGLKKATVEYAKDGLSMQKGLEKTIKSIKNAKTETEALAEVEKLFGAKGANEMVKAIREGRLSVDDLSSALTDYSGTVSNTFDATLDPIDQGKVALNNLKLAGSELAGTAQSVFAPMLLSIVDKLKSLVTWFGNLSTGGQKAVVIGLSVTAMLGPMVIGIGKLITAIGTILKYAPQIKAFFGFFTAHPIALVVTAIGLLVGALIAYKTSAYDAQDETKKLYKEIDEFNKKSREQKKEYDDMVTARAESARGIQAEYGYYENLVDELSNITDENGKVIEGYESRAKTITGILSDALGEEISTDQLVADGKQKVIDKITELLSVKRAEAQLQAYEASYTEAIQKSNDALNEYTQAEKNHKTIADDLAQAKINLAGAEKRYNDESDPRTRQQYKAQMEAEKRTVEDLTAKEKEASKTVKEKQDTYLGYVSTIQNYEGVTSAIIEGDTAKINTALQLLINDFITAENGTKASLEAQVKNAQTTLDNLKTALENGSPGVTQTMVDSAQDMVNRATAELNKLSGNGQTAGKKGGQATAEGLKSKTGDVANSSKTVVDTAKHNLNTLQGIGLTSGSKAGKQTASGLTSQAGNVRSGATFLATSAQSGLSGMPGMGTTAGQKTAKNTASGMTSKKGEVKTAGKDVATSGKTGLESVKTSESGKNFTLGFANGISDGGALSNVLTAVSNVASSAVAWLKQKIGEASPAKIPMKSGRFFTLGFAEGITQEDNAVDNAINDMGGNAIDTLNQTVKSRLADVKTALGESITNITEETESKKKAFDKALKSLDYERDFGLKTEEEYYDGLEKLRDQHLTKYSDSWYDTTKKLYDYRKTSEETLQKDILDDLKWSHERGYIDEKEYYKQLTTLRDKFYEAGSDEWYELDDEIFKYNKNLIMQTYQDVADFATSKLEEIADKRDSMESKLKDHGFLTQTVKINAGENSMEFVQLPDLSEQTAELEKYAELLNAVRDRGGVPGEFFSILRDMSVDEGMSFATALLQASDENFNAYITEWSNKQKLASEIADQMYQEDAQAIVDDVSTKFEALDDDFFGIGENSIYQFGEGFKLHMDEVLGEIRRSVSAKLSSILSGVKTANISFFSNAVPQMATGGIVDRPTVVQVGEDGSEAIIPLEKNTGWIDKLANKINNVGAPSKIILNNDGLVDKLDKIYDRLNRLQIVMNSGALVGEILDDIDSGLADKQILSSRGV